MQRKQTFELNAQSCGGCLLVYLGIVGAVVYIVSRSAAEPAIIIGAIAGVIALVGIIWYLRLHIAESFYDVMIPTPDRAVALGATVHWRPAVKANKGFRIGAATATLRCREHAINRGGTSDSHFRKEIYREEIILGQARKLYSGEVAEFSVKFDVPPGAIPSFHGRNNFIEWRLILKVPVPGICPDIQQEVPLVIEPETVDDRPLGADEGVPSEWADQAEKPTGRDEQGSVRGTLTARDTATVGSLFVMPMGSQRALRVTVQTTGDIHCRGVLCWVGCRIHGSGSTEEVALQDWHTIHEGDFGSGQVIDRSLDVEIPAGGPASFRGRYIKCDWMVRVRVDIPVWRDKVLELPFVVTPRLRQ